LVARYEVEGVRLSEAHAMWLDCHVWIEAPDRGFRTVDLGPPYIAGGMDDLALQVRERHHVVIDDAKRADAGRREIKQGRGAKTAGADHQHPRAFERRLAGAADLA